MTDTVDSLLLVTQTDAPKVVGRALQVLAVLNLGGLSGPNCLELSTTEVVWKALIKSDLDLAEEYKHETAKLGGIERVKVLIEAEQSFPLVHSQGLRVLQYIAELGALCSCCRCFVEVLPPTGQLNL